MDFDAYLSRISPVFAGAHSEAAREGSKELLSVHLARAVLSLPTTRASLTGIDLMDFEQRRQAAKPDLARLAGRVAGKSP